MTTLEIEETIMALQDRVALLRRQRSPALDAARGALRKFAAVRQRRLGREMRHLRTVPRAAR